jgi:capsular polysaccharide biosynthesis protein
LHRIQNLDELRASGNLRGRNFSNLDALCELLLSKGYVAYEPALIPIEHLVASLSQAEVIVAIHGAGLANLVFAPAGTRVYEITGRDSTWRCFEALSAILGHHFTELHQPDPPEADNPFIDLQRLREVL